MEEFPKPKPQAEQGPELSQKERFEAGRAALWEMADQGAPEEERRKAIVEW